MTTEFLLLSHSSPADTWSHISFSITSHLVALDIVVMSQTDFRACSILLSLLEQKVLFLNVSAVCASSDGCSRRMVLKLHKIPCPTHQQRCVYLYRETLANKINLCWNYKCAGTYTVISYLCSIQSLTNVLLVQHLGVIFFPFWKSSLPLLIS